MLLQGILRYKKVGTVPHSLVPLWFSLHSSSPSRGFKPRATPSSTKKTGRGMESALCPFFSLNHSFNHSPAFFFPFQAFAHFFPACFFPCFFFPRSFFQSFARSFFPHLTLDFLSFSPFLSLCLFLLIDSYRKRTATATGNKQQKKTWEEGDWSL